MSSVTEGVYKNMWDAYTSAYLQRRARAMRQTSIGLESMQEVLSTGYEIGHPILTCISSIWKTTGTFC